MLANPLDVTERMEIECPRAAAGRCRCRALGVVGIHVETTLPEYLALAGKPVEFRALIRQVTFAAKRVAAELRVAGLRGMLGATGATNVQGEAVQRLDKYANA